MKKPYSKPEILFEDFSLSTNIAGDCEKIITNVSSGTCGYILESKAVRGAVVFTTEMNSCNYYPQGNPSEDGEYNGVCYHVPYGNNLFNS